MTTVTRSNINMDKKTCNFSKKIFFLEAEYIYVPTQALAVQVEAHIVLADNCLCNNFSSFCNSPHVRGY